MLLLCQSTYHPRVDRDAMRIAERLPQAVEPPPDRPWARVAVPEHRAAVVRVLPRLDAAAERWLVQLPLPMGYDCARLRPLTPATCGPLPHSAAG